MNAPRRLLLSLPWLAAWPVWAQAPPRIVFIWPGSASGELPRSTPFKEGLRDIGLVAGRHYQLEELYADGQYERFPAMAAEVMKQPPALIMVVTIASVRAVQQATRTVPIVFVSTNDPVGSGLVASLAHPGGNTTGIANQAEDTIAKTVEMIRSVLPIAQRVAALVNPNNASHGLLFEVFRLAAAGQGLEARAFPAGEPAALDAAFAAIAPWRPEALLPIGDSMFFDQRERISAFSLRQRIALFGVGSTSGVTGPIVSYGPWAPAMFRHAARYVDKILKGAKPGDLPVEQPTEFRLVINLKTARALGLTIPQNLLVRADEVIE
jgi:putative tryptophan/tyrosine transport system substrate-binding protein